MLSSTRDIAPSCVENVDELIERQEKSLVQLDSKKNIVVDLIAKGKVILEHPDKPKFLEGNVKRIQEGWDDTKKKAQDRLKTMKPSHNSLRLPRRRSRWSRRGTTSMMPLLTRRRLWTRRSRLLMPSSRLSHASGTLLRLSKSSALPSSTLTPPLRPLTNGKRLPLLS